MLGFYKTAYSAAVIHYLPDYFRHAFVDHNLIVVGHGYDRIGCLLNVLNQIGVHRNRGFVNFRQDYHACSRAKSSLPHIVKMEPAP
jgi:hypothetical protein